MNCLWPLGTIGRNAAGSCVNVGRQQADDRELSGFKVREELDEALAAIELNDRQKATAIWTRLRNRYPTEVRGWPSALDVLLKLGRFSEAELLMREGQERYPREVHFASGLGATAHARGDDDQAVETMQRYESSFQAPSKVTSAAQSLAAAGRLEEAEALAKQAMGRFPGDIRGFLEYARLATRRDDLNEALKSDGLSSATRSAATALAIWAPRRR